MGVLSVSVLCALVAFAVLYRHRGGYYYRTAVMLICMAICALYGVIASLILPIFGRSDLINWSVARFYYNLGGFFTDVHVTIEGKQYLGKEPCVYVCNHQASLDVLFMASVFPKATAVVAKKSIKYYPFLGWFMTLSKAIFLDRKDRDSAIKQARRAAESIQREKMGVWLFPEGTRGHPSEINLLPFKKGAFYMAVQAQVPIVPIIVENYNHIYDSKLKRFTSGNIRIKVLSPVSTANVNETSEDIDKLCTGVRESMLETLRDLSQSNKKAQ